MLEKSVEFVTMAQLYMQAEVPYKAATLLNKEINSGRVDKNEKIIDYFLRHIRLQLKMKKHYQR